MSCSLLKTFTDARQLIRYGKGYLLIDYLGIHFLREDFQEADKIVDYFNGCNGIVFKKRYLFLENYALGFRVYDLEKKQLFSSIKLDYLMQTESHQVAVSKDEKQLIVMVCSPSPMSPELEWAHVLNKQVKSEQFFFTLPQLKFCYKKEFDISFSKMLYHSASESFVLQDVEKNMYFYQNGQLKPWYFKAETDLFFIFNERNEIYCFNSLGVRVYNDKGCEINKFDLLEDKRILMENEYLSLESLLDTTIDSSEYSLAYKRRITDAIPMYKNVFAIIQKDCLNSCSEIDLVNCSDGSFKLSIPCGFLIEEVAVVKEGIISFLSNNCLHILEVNYD